MLFIQLAASNPKFYAMWILLVVFSVCMHEYFHAQVALWFGDDTAAVNGHLTLNPLKQMGLISIITLLFFGICWGNIPINYNNLKTRTRIAITTVAGPFINLILFIIFSIIIAFLITKQQMTPSDSTVQFFVVGGMLNIVLLLFNLIPVPPLDGWIIITSIFPKLYRINQELRNGIIFGLFILFFFYFYKFFLIGEFCVNLVVNWIIKILL